MNRFIKTMVAISFVFVLLSVFVYGDIYHDNVSWSIPGSSYTSSSHAWTPAFNIPSGKLYVKAKCSSPNQGVTQYFTVSPHTSSYTVGKIIVDGALHKKTSSMAATGGTTYYSFAQRWDPSLTTDLTDGKTYFYSTNNS